MAEASYTVTLRIWHPTHSGQAITKAIGLQPYVSQTVGEPRVNPVGEKLGGEYKKTGCAFRLREKTLGYFVDGIRDLVPTLEKVRPYLKTIRQSGGRSELYVGVFVESTNGFTLETCELAALADLSLDLSVEYYL